MGPTLAQGIDASVYDVGGRVEVGLTDFEVHDLFALRFEGSRAAQDFKGGFGSQPRHPVGKTQFELGGVFHGGKPTDYIPEPIRISVTKRKALVGLFWMKCRKAGEGCRARCLLGDAVLFALRTQNAVY